MKDTNGKAKRRPSRVRSLAVTLACLLPAAAWAQDEEDDLGFALEEPAEPAPDPAAVRDLTEVRSVVEFGAGYVSDDSFRFGRYTGLNEEGLFGVLNFDLYRRGPYDADDARYWRVTGSNLGLDSRAVRAEQGEQGNYRIFFDYDQLPNFRSDSARTIFPGAGGTELTLPGGWVASDTTGGMTELEASLKDVDIESERRRAGAGFEKELGRGWDFKTRYRHETKDGLKTVGAVIGSTGGNPRAVILPEPIDYTTQQLDVVLGYADPKKQFRLSYYLSLFDDENESLTWQNPYTAHPQWDPSAGFPTGEGRLHLPPDNQFHQVTLGGGYDFTDTLRLSGDVAIGRMTQDEPFLPYTVNPTLAASITQPLPRDSLDGRIDTTLVNLRLAGRPTRAWRWNAAYRFDDRDNKTPRDEYVYIAGDSETQDASADSSRRRFNLPYSYAEHRLAFDTGYLLGTRTDVTAGVERREIERTFSEREETKENTVRAGLTRRFTDSLKGGVRFARSDRYGSTYRGEEPFLSSHSSDFTDTLAEEVRWENHPDLRKFHLADRVRDKATLFATFVPAEVVTLGLNVNYLNDDYRASELGLTESRATSYMLDAGFFLSEITTAYAFAGYEDLRSDQDGQDFRGFAKLSESQDPDRAWFVDHRDRVTTVGLGVKHTLIRDRLDVGADFAHSASRSDVEVTTGAALTSAPLPTIETRLNSLKLYGTYQWKKDVAVRAGYWVEDFKSTDWALDGVDPDTVGNVILLGEDSPDYTVHVVTLALRYRF